MPEQGPDTEPQVEPDLRLIGSLMVAGGQAAGCGDLPVLRSRHYAVL